MFAFSRKEDKKSKQVARKIITLPVASGLVPFNGKLRHLVVVNFSVSQENRTLFKRSDVKK